MVERKELLQYCEDLLNVSRFRDYAPNGLQVEGCHQINTLVTGVTACQALIDTAVEKNADAILVHHGYFWKGEDACIIGIKQRRLKTLLQHDMNLIAYHLPLDAHATLGNNAQLARLLDLQVRGGFAFNGEQAIGLYGQCRKPISSEAFASELSTVLGREAVHIRAGQSQIETLAWCSGAAQSFLQEAVDLGVDAYFSGEISEQTVHLAREAGIHYFAAGHHATERYGVQALGEHLQKKFALTHHFIDIDNPV